MKLGIWFYGLGTMFTGILNLAWVDFDSSHQPIESLGLGLPARHLLACIVGVWLIAAGLGILFSRTRKLAAAVSGAAYLLFLVFWIGRYMAGLHAPGPHLKLVFAVCFGLAQQLMLIAPAALLWFSASTDSRASSVPKPAVIASRWLLGLPSVVFGAMHLTAMRGFATLVPHWLPYAAFWTALTGVAFLLAGCAICAGKLDVLALRLLALMLLLFEPTVEIPPIFTRLHHLPTWGAAVYNITAIGACLLLAEYLAARAHRSAGPASDRTLSSLDQVVA